MGLFTGLKSNWMKSEAAVVIIQNLLEKQSNFGTCNLDAAKVANLSVGKAWETMPDVFNGNFGQAHTN